MNAIVRLGRGTALFAALGLCAAGAGCEQPAPAPPKSATTNGKTDTKPGDAKPGDAKPGDTPVGPPPDAETKPADGENKPADPPTTPPVDKPEGGSGKKPNADGGADVPE